jgi:glycosyltransferase involved in cell wall biosynthesis
MNLAGESFTIDVVTSARNESENISELYEQISSAMPVGAESWNLIISDNDSDDDTWKVIKDLSNEKPNVHGVRMSRNFGFEGSITAALTESKADIVIVMASDLQDSPENIPLFLEKFESGYDHVYQLVASRPDSTWIRSLNSKIFYALASKISGGLITRNSSTFRLMSSEMRDTLLAMPERNRYMRVMVNWVGFKSIGIEFDRATRHRGTSKANTAEVISYAVKLTLANSYYLLNLIGVIGLVASGISMATFILFFIIWLTLGVPFAGFGMIVALILLGFAFVLLFLGIISQYMSLMYEEMKQRPNFVIRERT